MSRCLTSCSTGVTNVILVCVSKSIAGDKTARFPLPSLALEGLASIASSIAHEL